MKKKEVQIGVGFDAVICLGNSFAHLLSDEDGDTTSQKIALKNFERLVKPNKGILIIDHRNYDAILRDGKVPEKNVYYNVSYIPISHNVYCSYYIIKYSFNKLYLTLLTC